MAANGKLLDSVVLSDATMAATQEKMSSKAAKAYLSFISLDMLCQSVAATAVSGIVYTSHSYLKFPINPDGPLQMVHLITGLLLGILLTARIVMGVYLTKIGTSDVYAFAKACRSICVLSTTINESLTISAGAENEKKAVSKFRFELVRLLNLAFYCYSLMLQGMRLAVPPTSLRPSDSSKLEAEVLSAVDNPTVMIAKMITSLLEQQRAAKRISNEQVSLIMSKVGELIEAYHSSLSMALSPAPVSLTAFAYFFTTVWCYFTGAAIAVIELGEQPGFETFGLGLTLVYTLFLSLFIFGLYEAGNVVESPLKYVLAVIATEDLSYSLSDDLASLIGDDSVPVFLSK